MKFFKAFSLLHRRVKSTTFEPGPAGLPQFATPPKAKTFSSSGEAGQTRGLSGLSFFDLVTSNPPVVPPSYLNHISRDDASDRVLGLWPSRRHSDKGVLSTFQSSVKKECTRLTEAVNFWIAEYTKMQNLLKNCHAELLVERLKTGNLESKLKLDQEEIERLRAVLNHCEKASCPSAPLEDSDGIYTVVGNTLPACTRTRIPSLNIESCLSSQMSTGVNAPDQYNSALHMILVARKNLRDQRKISKYWKGQAVILGQQNTITPSVSTISSIRDTLPADRHLAVRALMAQRGISLRLAQLEEGGASPKAVHTDLQDSAAVSDKTISKKESISMLSYANSESSRLGPLASESLKQEVNMLFGPSSPSKRLFPSRSRQIGAVIASKSCSVKTGLSNLSRYSHNIESFGDINTLFQKAFGTKHGAEQGAIKHHEACSCRESKSVVSDTELSLLVVNEMLDLSETMTSGMLESSIPSGCSQTWINLETIDPEFVIPDFTLPSGDAHDEQVLDRGNEDCTPRRSWQLYTTPRPSASSSHRPTQRSSLKKTPLRDILSRKTEKENDATSPLSMFSNKRKQSRLPVLTLAKKDVL